MTDSTDTTPETTANSLRDHFLIAMPSLNNSFFGQTITYICDHSEEGSMGLVINQAMDMNMSEIFRQLEDEDCSSHGDDLVICGGPVQPEQGFVLHSPEQEWQSTLQVSDEVSLTASRDVLDDIAAGQGPKKHLVALGYAGWSAGQLEEEIADNAWLIVKADSQLIFDTPLEQRWSAIAKELGIDLNLISGTVGHA